MRRVAACVLLVVAACGARGPAAGGEVRAAVLPGEGDRAPSEAVVAKLEVALSAEEGVELLERSEVGRILAERRLSLTGLTDPATVLKLGRILSAQVFVLVEKLPKTKPPAVRVQVIETRTGMVLAAMDGVEARLARDTTPAAEAVTSGLAKHRTPKSNRRFVGLLGFRNAEPGAFLDGPAEALGMLLMTQLARSPRVVVLDREHLERLQKERDLSDIELELKTSAVLLDGSVRRAPGGKDLEAAMSLRPLAAGGGVREVSLRIPADDFSAARRMIAAAVLEKLDAGAPAEAVPDPAREAEAFMSRAEILISHRETVPAVRAAEAAVALAPNQEMLARAVKIWDKRVRTIAMEIRNYPSDERWRRELVKMEPVLLKRVILLKPVLVRAALRETAIARQIINEHILAWKAGKPVSVELPVRRSIAHCPRDLKLGPEDREAKDLYDELLQAARSSYRLARGYYAARGASRQWWECQRWLVSDLWRSRTDIRDWDERFRKEFMSMLPASAGGTGGLRVPGSVKDALGAASVPTDNLTDEEQVVVLGTLDWMCQMPSAEIRFAAILRKIWILRKDKPACTAAAREGLEIILKEYRKTPNDRAIDKHTSAIGSLLLGIKDDALRVDYCKTILDPILKEGVTWRIHKWEHIFMRWLWTLRSLRRVTEGHEVSSRILAHIKDRDFRQDVEKYNQAMVKLLGDEAPDAAPSAYEIVPVEIGKRPEETNARIHAVMLRGDELIMAWDGWSHNVFRKRGKIYRISSVPLSGGRLVHVGSVTAPYLGVSKHLEKIPSMCCAATKAAVYLGPAEGGLLIFSESRGTAILTEKEGLPSNVVRAIGLLGNEVYLAVGKTTCSLVKFDPKNKEFTMLCSSRAQGDGPLDGGKPYKINNVITDEKRQCVWFSVHGDDRRGLWRYTPSRKEFKRVWDFSVSSHSRCFAERLSLHGDMVGVTWHYGTVIYFFDLETKKVIKRTGKRPFAFVGDRFVAITPVKGTNRLCLFSGREADPEPIARAAGAEKLKGVRLLHPHGRGAVIVTGKGEMFLMQPKAGE